jgi:hypothetical protein
MLENEIVSEAEAIARAERMPPRCDLIRDEAHVDE